MCVRVHTVCGRERCVSVCRWVGGTLSGMTGDGPRARGAAVRVLVEALGGWLGEQVAREHPGLLPVLAAVMELRPGSHTSASWVNGRAGTWRSHRRPDPRPGVLRAWAAVYAGRPGFDPGWLVDVDG